MYLVIEYREASWSYSVSKLNHKCLKKYIRCLIKYLLHAHYSPGLLGPGANKQPIYSLPLWILDPNDWTDIEPNVNVIDRKTRRNRQLQFVIRPVIEKSRENHGEVLM